MANEKAQVWHKAQTRQTVLWLKGLKSLETDFLGPDIQIRKIKGQTIVFWKMSQGEQRKWETEQWPSFHALYMKFLIRAAEANDCSLSQTKSSAREELTNALNWSAVAESAKACGTEIMKTVLQRFVDHISESFSLLQDLVRDPKAMAEKLMASFQNLDQTLVEGFRSFISVTSDLMSLAGEGAKALLCELLGDFTTTMALSVASGPKGLVMMGRNVKNFFKRLEKYEGLIGAVKKDPRIAKSAIYYSHYLEKIRLDVSTSATSFESKSLATHFDKHKSQFNVSSPAEYEKLARDFAESRRGLTIETPVGAVKWEPKTQEFLSVRKDGAIITYFKVTPDQQDPLERMVQNAAYFNKNDRKQLLPQ